MHKGKANTNSYNSEGDTALIYAAFKNYPETIQELIVGEADPNMPPQDEDAFAPVHWGTFTKAAAAIQILPQKCS